VKIPRLTAGGRPTFLEAAFANRVIDAVNAIGNATITPAGSGTVKSGEKNLIIDLSPLVAQIKAISENGNSSSAITNVTQNITNIYNNITTINNQISGIIGALQGVQISCDPDTSQITITFPGI
jgi:hypothetical protein